MSERLRLVLAVAVVATAAAVTFHGVALSDPADRVFLGLLTTALLAAPVVGALILVRRPDNRIGWLFLLMGLGSAASAVTQGYGYQALTHPDPLLRGLGAWFADWTYILYWMPAALLLLLFPTGRHRSERWKGVSGGLLAGAIGVTVTRTFGVPTFEVAGSSVPNPFQASPAVAQVLERIAGLLDAMLIGLLIMASASVLVRLRSAGGVERQQLKWFVAAGAMVTTFMLVSLATTHPVSDAFYILAILGIGAGLPVAAGIAILRHRLYDIDVVIRRTLVYGAVVAVLAVVYVGLVLTLQAALTGVTGGQTLPVAVSTLAIAALFGPVRARVRGLVDRRFYRSRYDAQRTLEAFTTRLRDEVELEAVGDALVATAGRAVRPTAGVVWLRSGAGR